MISSILRDGVAYVGAGVMAVLGGLHLVYTFRDIAGEPRHFSPQDKSLLDRLRATRTAIAPKGRDYWSGILGFHVSHGMGVLFFALTITLATSYHIQWLKPVLIAAALTYAITAWRCWFSTPMIGSLLTVLLLVGGWYGH